MGHSTTRAPRRRRRPVALISAALSAAAIALTGCSIAPDRPEEPLAPEGPVVADRSGVPSGPVDRLTWAIPADITTVDPLAAADRLTRSVLANVCESMLRMQPDGSIVPGLVEPVRVGGTELVYTVRPGARFSNGAPVAAADVVASLTARLDSRLPRDEQLDDVETVDVTGDDEVTVTLSRPNALVPQLLATAAGAVVSRASTPDEPVCSGPYTVGEWRRGRSVALERTPDYWDAANAGLAQQVQLRVMPVARERAEAVLRGKVHGTYDPPRGSMASLVDSRDVAVTFGRGTTVTSLAVSNHDGPLRDVRLRRALSLGVDRAALAARAPVAGAAPAKAPSSPAQWGGTPEQMRRWFLNLPPVTQSIEDARRLVVEAGVPERPIVLATGPDATSRAIAARVQDATVVTGLPVQVVQLSGDEWSALTEEPASRQDIDAYVLEHSTDVADPLQTYERFCRGEGDADNQRPEDGPGAAETSTAPEADDLDATAFDERTYNELCGRARAEYDRGPRLVIVDLMQKMAVAAHLWVPLYESPSVVAERREVTGAVTGFVRGSTAWAATIGRAP